MIKEDILPENVPERLPVLPLRDVVVFPQMIIPLFIGRGPSILAVESAMQAGKEMLVVTQKEPEATYPVAEDLHPIGTRVKILQKIQLPDASLRVLVEGQERFHVEVFEHEKHLWAKWLPLETEEYAGSEAECTAERRALLKLFSALVKRTKRYPLELYEHVEQISDLAAMVDRVAASLGIDVEAQQSILEAVSVSARVALLHQVLVRELDFLELEQRVQDRVKDKVDKTQRQFYLSAKIKALEEELADISGEAGAHFPEETGGLEVAISKAGMSKEAFAKAEQELKKLRMMSPVSAEATVCRSYIETLLALPWKKRSRVNIEMQQAESTLEIEHYGLKEVKERILEYLAVQHRVKKVRGPILCFVGPPGVGKTSLGASIAQATGRSFARVALGGVRDEAEIRGHRRTYIGAMPGKIIQRMMKVKVKNPVFMLDEVDKMAMDFRGDPASALLEVLDPEQNHAFSDHYLEIDYDLSEVMFIATANSMNIPAPLLDRMEVIRLSGYTEEEKLRIAERYLVPRQMEFAGLTEKEVHITEGALLEIIRQYTREAGVRNLEKEVSKILRKVVREIVSE